MLAAPTLQTAADVIGVEIQRVTDVLEGKNPQIAAGVKPFGCFSEEPTTAAIGSERIPLVAAYGFLENGEDETSFPLHRYDGNVFDHANSLCDVADLVLISLRRFVSADTSKGFDMR